MFELATQAEAVLVVPLPLLEREYDHYTAIACPGCPPLNASFKDYVLLTMLILSVHCAILWGINASDGALRCKYETSS
jgi:hypothetical protein